MSLPTILPWIGCQFFDDNGDPLANGKLYSYEAGSSTPQPLYTDTALSVAYTNPLPLDPSGRPAGPIYLLTTPAYKFILTDANDVPVGPTYDDIIAAAPSV